MRSTVALDPSFGGDSCLLEGLFQLRWNDCLPLVASPHHISQRQERTLEEQVQDVGDNVGCGDVVQNYVELQEKTQVSLRTDKNENSQHCPSSRDSFLRFV